VVNACGLHGASVSRDSSLTQRIADAHLAWGIRSGVQLNSGRGKAGSLRMLPLCLRHALLEDIEANGRLMLV